MKNRWLIVMIAVQWSVPAYAQNPPPQREDLLSQSYRREQMKQLEARMQKGSPDPLAGAFFPPELVMQFQQKLGLSAEQRTAIMQGMQKAQPRFIELQWQLQAEMETLAGLVNRPRPEEARVLQQLDRVLELERQTKRTQIEMLLRIKSTLTEAQQQQLAEFTKLKAEPARERRQP